MAIILFMLYLHNLIDYIIIRNKNEIINDNFLVFALHLQACVSRKSFTAFYVKMHDEY